MNASDPYYSLSKHRIHILIGHNSISSGGGVVYTNNFGVQKLTDVPQHTALMPRNRRVLQGCFDAWLTTLSFAIDYVTRWAHPTPAVFESPTHLAGLNLAA